MRDIDKTIYPDQEESELEAKRVRNSELEDMRALVKSPAGRRAMWRIMSRCGIYQRSFTGNSETFFREGRRDVGLFILEELEAASPEVIYQMQREQKSNEGQKKGE